VTCAAQPCFPCCAATARPPMADVCISG
jgi:hypothetical protein